jgi:hypothetical protein
MQHSPRPHTANSQSPMHSLSRLHHKKYCPICCAKYNTEANKENLFRLNSSRDQSHDDIDLAMKIQEIMKYDEKNTNACHHKHNNTTKVTNTTFFPKTTSIDVMAERAPSVDNSYNNNRISSTRTSTSSMPIARTSTQLRKSLQNGTIGTLLQTQEETLEKNTTIPIEPIPEQHDMILDDMDETDSEEDSYEDEEIKRRVEELKSFYAVQKIDMHIKECSVRVDESSDEEDEEQPDPKMATMRFDQMEGQYDDHHRQEEMMQYNDEDSSEGEMVPYDHCEFFF